MDPHSGMTALLASPVRPVISSKAKCPGITYRARIRASRGLIMAFDQTPRSTPQGKDPISKLDRALETVTHLGHISPSDAVDIRMCTTEAALNAITHGNLNDAAKTVMVEIRIDQERATIRVHDEGSGFDGGCADPTSAGNRLQPSGRGILMMRSFMDRVTYSHDQSGTTVEMVKTLNTARVF